MKREQIARGMLKLAKMLIGRGWYGYSDAQQEAGETVMTPDMKKLESLGKKIVSEMKKQYGVKMKYEAYMTHLPTPRAEVALYHEGSIAKLVSVASVYSRPPSDWGKKFEHQGYEVKYYAQRATGNANPYMEDSMGSMPSVGKVAKGVVKMREKLGDEKFYKMMGIDPADVGDKAATVESVKKAIGRTWFDVEEESGNHMLLTTRENGDVGDEEPGREDIREAKRIKGVLLKEFGSKNVSVRLEAVDEWVHIDVSIKSRTAVELLRIAEELVAGLKLHKYQILNENGKSLGFVEVGRKDPKAAQKKGQFKWPAKANGIVKVRYKGTVDKEVPKRASREVVARALSNKEYSAINKFSSWLKNKWPMRISSPLNDLLDVSEFEAMSADEMKDAVRALDEVSKELRKETHPAKKREYHRDADVLEKLMQRMRKVKVAAERVAYDYYEFHSKGDLHRNVLLNTLEEKGISFRDYDLSTTGIKAKNSKTEKVLRKLFASQDDESLYVTRKPGYSTELEREMKRLLRKEGFKPNKSDDRWHYMLSDNGLAYVVLDIENHVSYTRDGVELDRPYLTAGGQAFVYPMYEKTGYGKKFWRVPLTSPKMIQGKGFETWEDSDVQKYLRAVALDARKVADMVESADDEIDVDIGFDGLSVEEFKERYKKRRVYNPRLARTAAMTEGEKVMRKLQTFLKRQKYSVVSKPKLDEDWMGEYIKFRIESREFYYYTSKSFDNHAEAGTEQGRKDREKAEREADKAKQKAFNDLDGFARKHEEVAFVDVDQCGSKATCFDVEVRIKS